MASDIVDKFSSLLVNVKHLEVGYTATCPVCGGVIGFDSFAEKIGTCCANDCTEVDIFAKIGWVNPSASANGALPVDAILPQAPPPVAEAEPQDGAAGEALRATGDGGSNANNGGNDGNADGGDDDAGAHIREAVKAAEPPQGTIDWANHIIERYEKQLTGPDKDISKIYELPYTEAAAILSIEDPARYERLKGIIKSRGVSAVSLNDWSRRVREREHQIKAERKNRAGAAAKQQAKKTSLPSAEWQALSSSCQQRVDGNILFRDLVHGIRKFIRISEDQGIVLALWVLFTWLFEKIAETNPFIHVVAADKNCGKSTLLKVLRRLVRGGWLIASSTKSAFIRRAQRSRFTLLMDEADSFLQENEEFRNVLDAANDPDTAVIALSEKVNDEWTPIDINVFLPLAFASIKKLRRMDTVEDRSIHIHLERATKAERQLLIKASRRNLDKELKPFADRCARWATDNAAHIAKMDPKLDFEDGRDDDKWRPLIAIADYLDVGLGEKVPTIAKRIIGEAADDRTILGVRLLHDIKAVFDQRRESYGSPDADKIFSEDLCKELVKLDDRPWKSLPAGKGREPKPIDQRRVAAILRDYRTPADCSIQSLSIRIGTDTAKGYIREDFEDAWGRYPMPTDTEAEPEKPGEAPFDNSETHDFDNSDRHTGTTQRGVGESGDSVSVTENVCDEAKNATKPHGEKDCGVVTDKNSDFAGSTENEGISRSNRYENVAPRTCPLACTLGAGGSGCQHPENCPDGKVTPVNERLGPLMSSATGKWTTHTDLVARMIKFFGSIDLDPCSDEAMSVPAGCHYTEKDDGLIQPWFGKVFMNPPYGRSISAWTERLQSMLDSDVVTEAIALVPARVDTQWFRDLKPVRTLFINGRLKFGDAPNSAPFPSALLYFGDHPEKFAAAFRDLGRVVVDSPPSEQLAENDTEEF
jgi:hypothetical protein